VARPVTRNPKSAIGEPRSAIRKSRSVETLVLLVGLL